MAYELSIFDRIVLRYLERRNRQHHALGQMAVFAHDHIGTLINIQGVYDGPQLEQLFSRFQFEGDVAIDVGANIGNHANYFARRFKRVEAFEPHPRTFELLKFNAASNVNCHNLALGAASGTASLFDSVENMGATTMSKSLGGRKFEVPVKTLDECDFSESHIALIKIDVEGHELAVLKGAADTIRAKKPVVVFEQWESEFDGKETAAIRFMRSLGYQVWWQVPHSRVAKLFSKPRFATGPKVPKADHSMVVAVSEP